MAVVLRNVSPLGALEIPSLGIVVGPDELFTVDDDAAVGLIGQTSNFVVVQDDAPSDGE